jgi:hypothetical protein
MSGATFCANCDAPVDRWLVLEDKRYCSTSCIFDVLDARLDPAKVGE